MNILITSKDDYPQFIAGDKRVSIILAHEWMKWGHHVSFVCHSTAANYPPEVEGIQQHLLPDTSAIDTPRNRQALRTLITDEHIDIILQQHMRENGMVNLFGHVRDLTKVASVLHFDVNHDDDILSRNFFIAWRNGKSLKRWILDVGFYTRYLLCKRRTTYNDFSDLYRNAIKFSDKVVLLSSNMISSFCKRAQCTADKVTAIPNPASLTVDATACNRKEKLVVWAGRLDYSQKRTERMLRIWKQVQTSHRAWQLKILGSGDWDYWRSLTARHGVKNVEVVGFCDPMPYYERASIVCMTSTTEGWGLVLVEGQAHHCAVMAYDSYASASDIINDGKTGILVKPFSIKQYAERLGWLMDHEEERRGIAEAGAKSLVQYEASAIAARWIDLFQGLISNKSHSI